MDRYVIEVPSSDDPVIVGLKRRLAGLHIEAKQLGLFAFVEVAAEMEWCDFEVVKSYVQSELSPRQVGLKAEGLMGSIDRHVPDVRFRHVRCRAVLSGPYCEPCSAIKKAQFEFSLGDLRAVAEGAWASTKLLQARTRTDLAGLIAWIDRRKK